jgi:hypothetical protein
MGVVGPVLDLLDPIGLGRSKLYGLVDWPYDVAWNAREDLKPELRRLARQSAVARGSSRPNCFRQAKTGRAPKRGAPLIFTETKTAPSNTNALGAV